jgi:hypothetical protein
MHPLSLLLMNLALLAPPSQAAEQPLDAEAVLRRVAAMSPGEQQQWLRQIKARLYRTCDVLLGPGEAAKKKSQYDALLHQKIIPRKTLVELIDETEFRECAAAARLAVLATARAKELPPPALESSALPAEHRLDAAKSPSRLVQPTAPGSAAHDPAPPPTPTLPQAAPPPLRTTAPQAGPLLVANAASLSLQEKRGVSGNGIDTLASAALTPVPSPASAATTRGSGENRVERVAPSNALPNKTLPEAPSDAEKPASAKSVSDKLAPPLQEAKVEVNLSELGARIGAYNLSLRALEAELDEPRAWNAQRLCPLVEKLTSLVQQKTDLATYGRLVANRDRPQVAARESPRAIISQLGRAIFEARTRAGAADFRGSEADRQAELARLDALSRALAELTE